MRASVIRAVVAVGCLALAPAARADIQAVARQGTDNAPAILGDRVFYEGPAGGASLKILSSPLVGPASTLFTVQHPKYSNGDIYAQGIAVSPTRVAFGISEFLAVDPDGATAYQRVWAGPPAGPFTPVAGDAKGNVLVNSFDLSGDELVTIEGNEFGGKPYVYDLAAGTPAVKLSTVDADVARIAGDYVAIGRRASDAKSERVTVTNWRTRTDLYQVDVPTTPPYAYGFAMDLQADGTIAVLSADARSTGGVPRDDAGWVSAASPTLHLVAQDVATDTIRIDGGRILFKRAKGSAGTELVVADLAGNVTPVSFPLAYTDGADIDADRIAFATNDCIYAGTIPASAPAIAPSGTCPQVALDLSTVPVKAPGVVKAKVTCVMAATNGCTGTVTVRAQARRGRKAVTVASAPFHADAGATAVVFARANASGLRALRARTPKRGRTTYVNVFARATDDAGLGTTTRRDDSVWTR